ncbi:histidine kinase OS=Tsukamurella paurometabola (strain ATCC 8368 / DSM / CCUG 35730 / CIP 100753/ JCM 10117 / KCTC 9821 / NBRC 16120 / NCIMB 702349 / NCTC 13040) OX=521096 GN=Tpau_2413 PE=4 SV=1 [Tsukamurella paurometabola]|uniref:histidine kinase n=1 Tax=Tsukamurella paurometabola (strain ATCC 8368 / DSM 20162 / CCUG 35730 / CIP 100753 / JCM 10117 / KCTC 9821 / NBRC 16120 / NCIMB 702349 / NCTC 13040) TaxID=521096 RepID=D5UR30_TSUPD|nr:histidine kinase [Tsukamurella paurometabola]ADG79019.1 integral membrane sensor signal transduction histidine kinase [Tsukamurella paurometabola DSM 20162]SUP33793.1 Nitrate/nitrite sensor protein narX [Tsukamurella paurometabola]
MTGAERERLRTLSGELVLVVLAALDAWSVRNPVFGWNDALLMVAVLALPLRNRAPLVVFAIALVVAIEDGVVVIPTVAMYAVAVNFQRVIVPLAAGAALAGTMTVSMLSAAAAAQETPPTRELVSTIGYSVAMVGAPLAFGRLVRARRELAAQLAELTEAQDDQRRLHEHNVLSRERAQLAREMHDVVSHQVSLIAVEAGALQVTATDEAARESARSVRRLAVSTLDELRHMVGVLRASGTEANGLAPQPTAGDLPQLIATSGLSVNLVGEVPGDLSPAVARAVYRTTQEALTNARKHAPGAGVEVTVEAVGRGLRVRTENSRPTRVALDLPGSKVGLLGLRERAESLGGTLQAGPTSAGGFVVTLAVPDRTA